MELVFKVVLLLAVACLSSHASRILYVNEVVSKSFHVFHSVFVKELASRGHQITYLSPYIDKKPPPNVKQILIEGAAEAMLEQGEEFIEMFDHLSPTSILKDCDDYYTATCELTFQSKNFQHFLETAKSQTYDLIIMDYGISECILGILDLYPDTPVVGLTAFSGAFSTNEVVGNPDSLAIKPLMLTLKHGKMAFLDRVYNVLVHLLTTFDRHVFQIPTEDKIMKTYIPQSTNIRKLHGRYSLLLMNDHFTISPPKPLVPALIHVAGMHIVEPKPLPQDIKKFLDDAKDGAVFFSLGSNVHSSSLGDKNIKILKDALKELAPLKVLWKFEKDLPGLPDNVMIKPWLPQSDILAHPNVKAFFSHSGLLSSLESLHRGVPIVGMPFLVDQHINLATAINQGYAEKIYYGNLNKEAVVSTVRKVATDPKYKQNVERLSKIFRDQPEHPLQRAVYWAEYVIRHKGAKHLRCDSLDLTWYENLLLDVALFFAIILLVVYKIVKLIVCQLCCRSQTKVKTH